MKSGYVELEEKELTNRDLFFLEIQEILNK